ncbi:MAG: hypothetical protein AAFO01_07605 [Pseudomonadota bacterium]
MESGLGVFVASVNDDITFGGTIIARDHGVERSPQAGIEDNGPPATFPIDRGARFIQRRAFIDAGRAQGRRGQRGDLALFFLFCPIREA